MLKAAAPGVNEVAATTTSVGATAGGTTTEWGEPLSRSAPVGRTDEDRPAAWLATHGSRHPESWREARRQLNCVRAANPSAVEEVGAGVQQWLGKGSVVKRADGRGIVVQSKDGLRQFRMDLEGHGKWPPHAHLQVFDPVKGRFIDAPGAPHHLYFKDVPKP